MPVKRRQFLATSGLAALACSPALRSLAPTGLDPNRLAEQGYLQWFADEVMRKF